MSWGRAGVGLDFGGKGGKGRDNLSPSFGGAGLSCVTLYNEFVKDRYGGWVGKGWDNY